MSRPLTFEFSERAANLDENGNPHTEAAQRLCASIDLVNNHGANLSRNRVAFTNAARQVLARRADRRQILGSGPDHGPAHTRKMTCTRSDRSAGMWPGRASSGLRNNLSHP